MVREEEGRTRGFRAKRSTSEQIFILKETVLGRKRAKKKTYCCFLDIRKLMTRCGGKGCGKG